MDFTKMVDAGQTLVWAWLGLGALGSALEKVGMEADVPKLVSVGKLLESLSVDLPKLFNIFRR